MSAPAAPHILKRRRVRLGACRTIGDQSLVYDTGEALEIDTAEGYEIERRRVFYSDVLLIAQCRRVNVLNAVLFSLGLIACGLIALSAWSSPGARVGVLTTLAFALAFAGMLLLTLLRPQARVTVFGKRSMARMRWNFRISRADAVYAQLVARTREVQEEDRRRIAARSPASSPFDPPASPGPAGVADAAAPQEPLGPGRAAVRDGDEL